MNTQNQAILFAKRTLRSRLHLKVMLMVLSLNTAHSATTIGTAPHYTAIPPLIDLSGSGDKPNVLIILDNSNSMDEAANGSAVGSANSGSKSEIARGAVKTIVNNFGAAARLGLMAYKQKDVSVRYLHNAAYDASFDPANYDPNFSGSPRDSLTKKFRTPNLSNPGEFVYYNVALPYYGNGNDGVAFCRSTKADFDNDPGGYTNRSYSCFENKTDTSDDLNSGFSTSIGNYTFSPTDSDIAQGIIEFGRFMTWSYVSKAWASTKSPGKGILHVDIADVDTAHENKLLAKLATSQFSSNTDTPLRNAGLTPLAGTLQSAESYFSGSLSSSERASGVTGTLPPANACSMDNDFVVLVTDGLPSVDASGNETTDTASAIAAAAAAAQSLFNTGVKTYVVGFALPNGVDATVLDQIASAGGTTTAYLANDSDSLNAALGSIFLNISNRLSSATGAAVLANSAQGGGAIFQANYTPKIIDAGNRKVSWVGAISGLFIDEKGHLREDTNGNKTLDGYNVDKVIRYFYDTSVTPNRTRIYTYLSATANGEPNMTTPTGTKEIKDLKVLWEGRDRLAALTNTSTQRAYSADASTGRHVLTSVDGSNLTDFKTMDASDLAALTSAESSALTALNLAKADVVAAISASQEVKDAAQAALDLAQKAFNKASLEALNSTFLNYLMEPTGTKANTLVEYIRGEEKAGYRSRTIDIDGDGTAEVWRLGDIIHSTPALVGAPADNYDAYYHDSTYAAFREQYKDRRHMVYVGANDGMLHAFNAGFWDKNAKKYHLDNAFANQGSSSVTDHPLGSELWSYIPRSALPHLQWLKDPGYAHSYYVDGEPKTFDANIFTADADHPYGWGTVLVIGMRLGGGEIEVDTDGDGSTDTTTYSSYIIMDVTNPEKPPQLMAEISHSLLGFTTSEVGLVKERVAQSGTDYINTSKNNWHLVFGSGPDTLSGVTSTRTAKLFVYDLVAKGFVTGLAPKDLSIANSFVGSVHVANWDNTFVDNTAYFGVVGGTPSAPTGRLMRYHPDQSPSLATSELINTSRASMGHPLAAVDGNGRKWVYFGTGRLFDDEDNTSVALQRFYGVIEPVDNKGVETWGAVNPATLEDVTDIRVFTDGYIDKSSGGAIEIPSGTVLTTFDGLKAALPKYRGGWFRDLNPSTSSSDPSGRNVNYAVKKKSTIEFVEYTPSSLVCQPEGTSLLYGVDFQTGTAAPFVVFDSDSSTQHNSADLSLLTENLGQGLAGHLSITKDGVRYSDSTGKTENVGLNLGPSIVGRQSWIEIELD